ncbi:dihydrodipicolinate synthase family protein [Mycobacteroides franklinii]|uniref:4-hydroxy-tetrahydrodipicolinate synthase n=1 Tax=Mycobacteroides franklinii TaxID=948102 RepID=A0A4R8QWT1_9MYCO|nr:dihydrodipicolinate synthase family protein [Mycobacteroides franklinii]TDZ41675.1 4-hydroxy-tetrahydrodipicolinate synthase [Mycobacteroides franklinii]TDZ47100.1 4-hydroxy-tetrahydrodipicolinate synthase [Mycobacteroides franklinii]TDZ55229.1 4-hydroxy-tetrahydrodipicolinate synthase [Mycobacteroides franklinii]TDZ62170.1 4-hydroxy-tetrahydrodipicolinate synthase [Mycobacteroides franklinii]TDZ68568.1 4-hydroxy-tetrahydrodipicolinate synthase [Mycobacteroides franklinii]
MTSAPQFHGIIAYPVTPFLPDDTVDVDRLAELVSRLADDGAHAIAPLGSTGESAYLEEREFDAVVDTTVAAVNKRVPIIVGASDLTTANTIRRARHAQQAGADAVMVLPISYWKLSDREIAQHYASVAAAIDIPVMAYNNPATSGVDMRPELLVSMFRDIDNVTMVKESTGDVRRMLDIKRLSEEQLPFYNGSNPLVLEALHVGASGWCTAAPCLAPQPCLDLYEAVRTGRHDDAASIYAALKPLLQFIVAGGLPTTVKAGLELQGRAVGDPRRPLLPLDAEGRETLKGILASHS